jgi:hypothetical protein
VRYADDLVLLAKEEKVLQGIIDRLTEVGRCHGMEMNVDKSMTLRSPKQPFRVGIIKKKKQLENVEYFSYLGSLITDDTRCTGVTKDRIITTKAASNKKTRFTSKKDVYLRKKLV